MDTVSVEATLDCDYNDLNSQSICDVDKMNAAVERCGGPARTEFLL